MSDSKEKKMKIPISFIPYLEKHRIYGFFQDLLGKLIVNKPDDHLFFLRNTITEFIQQQTPTTTFYLLDEESVRNVEIQPDEADEKSLSKRKDILGISEEVDTGLYKENTSKLDVKLISDDEDVSDNIYLTKEQSEFCEKVISDWRKIRRSKKWFSIRHLTRRNDSTDDDDDISSTFKKTQGLSGHRINLSLNTEEKPLKKSEAGDLHSVHVSEDDWNSLKRSIRTFNIKFSEDGNEAGNEGKHSFEHVIGLSIIDSEQSHEFDIIKNQQKKYEGEDNCSEDNKDDITPFVIKLVQETANEIMSKTVKHPSSYLMQNERESKRQIIFPRGPYMMPRVVILGPPGSGKSLQASLLAKRLNLIHIEMDEILLREHQRNNKIPTNLMDRSFRYSDLSTEILISVLKKRLLEEDCLEHGWVLTGFPLTVSQAIALDNLETSPNRFIYLKKPLDICRDVLLTRVHTTETGQGLLASNSYEDAISYKSSKENDSDYNTGLITVLDNKYPMESKDATGNSYLIHSVGRSTVPELTIYKPHEKFVKGINHSLSQHEAAKSMMLHYYGAWCKKLKVNSLHPQRVNEAIVNVVVGPFPSFEEATIYDRTPQKISMASLSSEIQSELKLRLDEFLSKEIPDTFDTNV